MAKSLDSRKRTWIKNNVIYTILKYFPVIDFSPIQEQSALAYRYLITNILWLLEDKKEREKKDGLNPK